MITSLSITTVHLYVNYHTLFTLSKKKFPDHQVIINKILLLTLQLAHPTVRPASTTLTARLARMIFWTASSLSPRPARNRVLPEFQNFLHRNSSSRNPPPAAPSSAIRLTSSTRPLTPVIRALRTVSPVRQNAPAAPPATPSFTTFSATPSASANQATQ